MMEIIQMKEYHIPDIVDMEKMYFSDPWSANAFLYELDNPLSLWLVAVENNQVIGYVGCQTVMDESDMMNLAVREEYRRCGIAKMLIENLISYLKDNGVCALLLEVRVSNSPAISLYEKLGFVQVGRRPKYYFNPREDAFIMRKEWSV